MNAKEKNRIASELEAEAATASESDPRKYSLRGAQQAIARRKAAVQKREAKILTMQAENRADRLEIRKLEALCDELRKGEIVKRIGHLCSAGNEMTTERINKMLDFCALVGDALSDVSVEQLVSMMQGQIGQEELAAKAQAQYEQHISTDSEE